MKYSVHLDECIRVVEEKPEYPTDLLLVELVKITYLGERISETVLITHRDNEIQVPSALQLGSFQTELDALKKGVPDAWGNDGMSSISYLFHFTCAWIFEGTLL